MHCLVFYHGLRIPKSANFGGGDGCLYDVCI